MVRRGGEPWTPRQRSCRLCGGAEEPEEISESHTYDRVGVKEYKATGQFPIPFSYPIP